MYKYFIFNVVSLILCCNFGFSESNFKEKDITELFAKIELKFEQSFNEGLLNSDMGYYNEKSQFLYPYTPTITGKDGKQGLIYFKNVCHTLKIDVEEAVLMSDVRAYFKEKVYGYNLNGTLITTLRGVGICKKIKERWIVDVYILNVLDTI